MKHIFVRLAAAVAAAAFALSLAGCTAGSGVNSFTWFVEEIPANLDPQIASAPEDVLAGKNLYGGLVRLDASGQPQPDLCEGWSVSAGGLTYTFTLKPGLAYKAARGEDTAYAITAEDFVYAFQRVFLPETRSPYAAEFSALENAAAILAVTSAGYVRTRVARVREGLTREKAAQLASLLNHSLTFVAAVDLSRRALADLCSQIEPALVPVVSAAAAILEESATPRVYLGGEPFLLNWPQLEGKVQTILTLLNDEAAAARLIAAPAEGASVLLGEDMEPRIPGLSVVSCRYLVGGGLYGSVALVGPTRMPFSKVIPLLEAFADELGEGMAGKRKESPQAAVPRQTVIYKEELE